MWETNIGTFLQMAYAVEGDVTSFAEEFSKKLGIGPFFTMQSGGFKEFIFKGEPQDPRIQAAIAYWGDVQIELSQCINGAKTHHSVGHKSGLHHICVTVDDLDETIARFNLEDKIMLKMISGRGLRNIYLESYFPGGYHLEIGEKNESVLETFAKIKAACSVWDGTRPVRDVSELLTG